MKYNKLPTIQIVVIRTFILITGLIILFSLFGTIYFNNQSIKIVRENSIEKIHETLTHLISPSLTITDTTEVRHLLKLASSPDEIFSVINANNDVILADYSQLNYIKLLYNNSESLDCKKINSTIKYINGKKYSIHCTRISSSNIYDKTEYIGTLVSLSHQPIQAISPLIVYFIGTMLLGFLLTVFTLRYIIKKLILNPLVELKNHIVNKAKSPLNCDMNYHTYTAPHEIQMIGITFDKIVSDLQNEYQLRIDATKNKALLDLAAQVAHDIRSPLAVMEISLSSIPQDLHSNQISLLKDAIHSVRTIAKNLLDRYRTHIIQPNEDTDSQIITLATTLQSIVNMKLQEWAHHPCKLTLEINNNASDCQINASFATFSRVISNLLNNAYESLSNKRKIHLCLQKVHQQILLTINDTGCGIPNEQLNDVLRGLSFKLNGTGLGLSSANRFMQALDGNITISSVVDQGTMVSLIFNQHSSAKQILRIPPQKNGHLSKQLSALQNMPGLSTKV